MENEIKKKKKKVVSPKGLKPKNHKKKKQAPKPMKEEKRKEVHIRRWKKNQCKGAELGSPEAAKGLGSSRRIAQLRQD